MYRVKDPVFAMAESFFLDGGSRLDDVDLRSAQFIVIPGPCLITQRAACKPILSTVQVRRSDVANFWRA